MPTYLSLYHSWNLLRIDIFDGLLKKLIIPKEPHFAYLLTRLLLSSFKFFKYVY